MMRTALFPASPLMWWTALTATLHWATALVVSPSPSLSPVDVVTSQMTALQKGDVRAAFEFASPANRVNTGPWQNFEMMVRQTPAYSPLVQCSSFEIVGALPFGDERMRCRVRVKGLEVRKQARCPRRCSAFTRELSAVRLRQLRMRSSEVAR